MCKNTHARTHKTVTREEEEGEQEKKGCRQVQTVVSREEKPSRPS